MEHHGPIGVLDSGMGGFTVIRALQRVLPGEDLVFCGDGKNVPYGNRSRDEILDLARQSLDFLQKRRVRLAVAACNTISALIDVLQDEYPFPILSVVQAGCQELGRQRPPAAAVLSTVFTAQSGCYPYLAAHTAPGTRLYVRGSVGLAALIEAGELEGPLLEAELDRSLGPLAAEHPELDVLVLGCTHFPIVEEQIARRFPQFATLLDPAQTLAEQLRRRLEAEGGPAPGEDGRLEVFTSGHCGRYADMARRLGLRLSGPVRQTT